MESQHLLRLKDVQIRLGDTNVLQSVDLFLGRNETLALLGRSGEGKTSLLRVVSGLESVRHGTVERAPDLSSSDIGFLMQESGLLPWRTVWENIVLLSELGRSHQPASVERGRQLLKAVRLWERRDAQISTLSKGMRQRAALAQALFVPKRLLLLDEPFNALDVHTREELYTLLKALQKEYKFSLLFVTHDFRDALQLADRLCVLTAGRIAWTGMVQAHDKETLVTLLRDAMVKEKGLTSESVKP